MQLKCKIQMAFEQEIAEPVRLAKLQVVAEEHFLLLFMNQAGALIQ